MSYLFQQAGRVTVMVMLHRRGMVFIRYVMTLGLISVLSGLSMCAMRGVYPNIQPPDPTPHGLSDLNTELESDNLDYPSPASETQLSSQRMRFERISIEEGLSQSSVFSILQDRKGFMWFATLDGLNKYDGYSFNVYKPSTSESVNLSHRSIRALLVDRNDNLWIGTDGGGLNRYDPRTGKFVTFRHQDNDPNSLSSDFITAVYEDSKGGFWVGTIDGLNYYDSQRDNIIRYNHDPLNNRSLSSNQVLTVFEDRFGVLWVGTDAGGLNQLDRSTNTFIHYVSDPGDPSSLSSDTVRTIYEDRSGQLWIGTAGGGLNHFQRETSSFERYTGNPKDPYVISSNDVTAIFEDSLGTFWIGTYGGGLNRFDRDLERFEQMRHDASDPTSLSSDFVLSIYEDRTGVLWIGTNGGGLNKVKRLVPRFQHISVSSSGTGSGGGLNNDVVNAIFEDRTGILWIGTNGGGLNRWDRKLDTWDHYRHDPNDPGTLGNDLVNAIAVDGQGILWVGTERGGLNRFDPQTGRFSNYNHDDNDPLSLSDNTVLGVHVDSGGDLWIGTRAGLDRLDRNDNSFIHYFPVVGGESEVSAPYVHAIYDDIDGNIWFGVGDHGLYMLDNKSEHLIRLDISDEQDALANYKVMSIHEDQEGILWIGTFGDGLIRYDRTGGRFAQFREQNGLPNDIVFGILESDEGHLWLSTNNGLSRFDPEQIIFSNYDVDDGLQSREFNPGAFMKGDDGMMYFGGIHGFNYFNPQNIGAGNPYSPSVVLTALTQDGRSVAGDLVVEDLEEITFRWPDNGFEFEFVGLSYVRPDKNQYAYKLEGFEDGWNYIGEKRYGRYTNLPGGAYTLHLTAANNDGVWNEEGASIEVRIIPPLWESWWFRGGVVLFLFVALVGGYRYRLHSVEAHSRVLETQVAERTVQLSTMNRLLENEINERKRVESELAQRAVDIAVEAERSRLARELHDAVTQTLFSASLIAEALPVSWESDPEEGRELLGELRQLNRGALAEMRSLLLELRPTALVEARLDDLIRQLAEAATGREGLPIDVMIEGEGSLPSDVHIALYRIAQEALNNVLKHARASRVIVQLEYQMSLEDESTREAPQVVRLIIQDDGRGFDVGDVTADHMGLVIMHERAQAVGATFEIHSRKESGTEVIVYWQGNLKKEERAND